MQYLLKYTTGLEAASTALAAVGAGLHECFMNVSGLSEEALHGTSAGIGAEHRRHCIG